MFGREINQRKVPVAEIWSILEPLLNDVTKQLYQCFSCVVKI